jgi:hypothetical protein
MSEILKDLWKDKPLLIAVVVGVAGIVYILYKSQNGGAVAAADTTNSAAGTGSTQTYPVSPAATYVEESYYAPTTTTSTSTSTSTQSIVPKPTKSVPTLITPAAKGTLGSTGAGKGDTNYWVYTVPPGSTLLSLAQFAKWGNNATKLANYRNNSQILQAAGVNISNPLAPVPSGLQISV